MGRIRLCRPDEHARILEVINAAAETYRGVIPDDCWHEPYFSASQLEQELAADVRFHGYEMDGELVGVIGFQPVRDVDLIRHAYVVPSAQGLGVGTRLLKHLRGLSARPMLVGTWADAAWAIRFYQRHGFVLVPEDQRALLLERYWTVSRRQIETSVVLANPPMRADGS